MSKVTISLNGRAFTIGCEDGQQAYLRELAAHLDGHVRDLAERVGQIGDVRLLLMAALIVGDELREAQGRIEALEEDLTETRGRLSQAEARRRADRARAAEAINTAAARLEALVQPGASDEQDA
ncbi:cell division protein ZapA [Alkalicaulis satelles]|uniref:Cell division protein ZapA n=1 Tax=Alkalicaulis satelles TaxID=2609175 RepID=A0A5M6ZI14_9PROT|nr:cell division protein ZapA [Alkalicaulis satelles]KAA5803950.1 cell division protein ZapA [Alkalicaulis satelles]